jgi:hypothetical protein
LTNVFCPSCRDEFRAGFVRCGRCDVDLVAELPAEHELGAPPVAPPAAPVALAEYCGFLELDDARHARALLRAERIACEIVIREAPDANPSTPLREEYWLRVDRDRYREVHALVGEPELATAADGFACSRCGQPAASEETFCASCGARFDEA